MAAIVLDQITKSFGATRAIDEICLSVASGEFLTLLGPSGCGKSSLLRAVAGLTFIDRGAVLIGDRDVTRTPIHQREIGMVFQSLALFPHMTVAGNVAFGLRMRKVSGAERSRRVAEALDLVHLSDFGDRLPSQLSGGQQQRVAIARALVFNPRVLLLDEPFSALDRKLREEMQGELRNITRRVGITALFVTHDQEEALTLSDRIAVLNNGRLEQVGTPTDIYETPETSFVADFMGAKNLIAGTVVAIGGPQVRLAAGGLSVIAPAPDNLHVHVGKPLTFTIRPERIVLSADTSAAARAAGTVRSAIYQGAFTTYEIDLDCGLRLTVRHAGPVATQPISAGQRAGVTWRDDDILVLRAAPRDMAGAAASLTSSASGVQS